MMPSLYRLLFESLPTKCLLCGRWQNLLGVCSYCDPHLPKINKGCSICLEEVNSSSICGQCQNNTPYFDNANAPWVFSNPINNWVHQLKTRPLLDLAYFFAHRIAKAHPIQPDKEIAIVPVPLHNKKLKERGFNQAELIAKPLSKILKLKYLNSLFEKTKETTSQSGLSKEDRSKNLSGAFKVKYSPPKKVILVDDVITTGSTANELAKTLKYAGCEHVQVLTACKTLKK